MNQTTFFSDLWRESKWKRLMENGIGETGPICLDLTLDIRYMIAGVYFKFHETDSSFKC